ncbi:MAG: DUF2726 domain-containing protein [Anaerolineales bacterium]|nr:DUF2726 domain-containing protein [Anaerolineales bacterium]
MANRSTPTPKEDQPYRLRDYFLSTPEIALLRLLQQMVVERYVICPKVALTDIFTIVRPNENVHFYNKIFRKHVDFLLCYPQTLQPAIAIELVKPVGRSETRPNDQFMEDIFLREGIPLVHVPLGDRYEMADIVHLFQLAVAKTQDTVRPVGNAVNDSSPMCPICGRMMVLRVHRTGTQAGKKYYGCMDSPRCAGTLEIA